MIELANEESTYVFHRNGKIEIKNQIDQNFSYISSKEYINHISQDLIPNYKRINVNDYEYKIQISDILSQVEAFCHNINNINGKNNKFQYYSNEFSAIIEKIQYFQNSENQTCLNCDDNIYKIYVMFQNADFNSADNIQKIPEYIEYLNKAFNQIINFLKILKLIHYKIFLILSNVTILLNEFYINQKNVETQKITCIINQSQEPILIFNDDSKINKSILKVNIIQLFSEILITYQEIIKSDTSIFQTEDESDINYIFKREILTFLFQIKKIIILNFKEKRSILNIIRPKLKPDENTADNYWKSLLLPHSQSKSASVIKSNIDSIFQFYHDYVEASQKVEFFQELIKIYKGDESNSNDDIIEEIVESKKYFYFNFFIRILLKKFLNQNFLTSQILNGSQNKYTAIREYSFLSSKICYDKHFNFVLEINCNGIGFFEKNYSKFIVQLIEKVPEKSIIIPYFPLGTLHSLFNNRQQNKVEFSYVDKLIIILEISFALLDIHSKSEFHGNLSSQSIFINSKKDAYLNTFSDNSDISLFYRSPVEIKYPKLNDIYSLGVLMHSIFTEKLPESRTEGKSKDDINQILTENYSNFLFSGDQNECFNDESLIGVKEIIENCMKKESEERYQSIEKVIDKIKELMIYERNEEEIEYRINNAYDSHKYSCSISEVVLSYYLGQRESLEDIEKTLLSYQQLPLQSSIIKGDIIKSIYETFDIIKDDDFPLILNDLHLPNCDEIDEKHGIFSEHYIDFLSPNFSLGIVVNTKNTMPFNHNDLSLMWAYFISKQLSDIHAKNRYFGELTKDNISVYYNKETNTFIPSIGASFNSTLLKKLDDNSELEKRQKEDVGQFKSIISLLNGIPRKVFNEVDELKTMKEISMLLYQYNIGDPDDNKRKTFKKNNSSYFYSNIKEHPFNEFLSFSNELIPQFKATDKYWQNLFQLSKYHSPQKSSTILKIIESIIYFYNDYDINLPLKKSYEEFLKILKIKNFESESLQKRVEQSIDQLQQEGKYFYIDLLIQIILSNLLDQNFFKPKIDEQEEADSSYSNNKYKTIKDFSLINNSSYKVCIDTNYNFYLQYLLSSNNGELNNKEIEIYKSDNYSKFVIHLVEQLQDNFVIIPYFPLGTLDSIILNSYQNRNSIQTTKKIEFTFVDKIVIILEIANAIKSLHLNDQYHGNLASQSIFMSSKKDAYLGGFSYDKLIDTNASKSTSTFFYRPPEVHSNLLDNLNKEDLLEKQKLVDIYSFGVLMHEIITETPPKSRIGNKTRSGISATVSNFCEFLFSGYNNEYFNDNWSDIRGDSLIGVKEIIENCMKKESEERYQSIEKVIDKIKELMIYERNEEEIEYRINNAYDSHKYSCSISEVVLSYYLGQRESLEDIEKTLLSYQQLPLQSSKFSLANEDIIKSIFEIFEIKSDKDMTYFFKDIFDLIIHHYLKKKLCQKQIESNNKRLYSFSIEANRKRGIVECMNVDENFFDSSANVIIPVSSFQNFIQNNHSKYSKLSLLFAFFIAREISILHAENIFHGNISTETIGIYYNNKTKTLIPSLILYNSIYKSFLNEQNFNHFSFSSEKVIEKMKRKDIKKYKKILHEIEGISNTVLKEIDEMDSICIIMRYLYNEIIKSKDKKQKEKFFNNYSDICLSQSLILDYSSLNVSFSLLLEIFDFMKNNFSLNDLFIDFGIIFQMINKFLENSITNPSVTFKNNIDENTFNLNDLQNEEEILHLYELIKSNSSKLVQMINQLNSTTEINDPVTINVGNGLFTISSKKFQVNTKPEEIKNNIDFGLVQRRKYDARIKFQNQFVERKIEISMLHLRSVYFLLERFLMSLNPEINYTLIIRIVNKTFSPFQDVPITAEHVIYLAHKFGFFNIMIKNGLVIIHVDSIYRKNRELKENSNT